MNNFQSIHEYLVLVRNKYREWAKISLCFFCLVSFSKETYIQVKKKKLLQKYERKNVQVFMNIIPMPICKFWDSQTIPIPIRTEFGSTNLFLFLFAGKIII